jgi:malonyl-CoA O-methyltransferase
MTHSLAWLQHEITLRMRAKLAFMKIQPKKILIWPDYNTTANRALIQKYSEASIDSLIDSNLNALDYWRLRFSRLSQSLWRGGRLVKSSISNELATTHFDASSFDFIFSPLLVHRFIKPPLFIEEIQRILQENGLFSFAYFGPDTGKEIFNLGAKLPGAWDMHDVGDALVAARFSDPVMDMEYLTLDYETEATYFADAQAIGLLPLSASVEEKQTWIMPESRKLSLEIVYGHAWAGNKLLGSQPRKEVFISPDQIKRL